MRQWTASSRIAGGMLVGFILLGVAWRVNEGFSSPPLPHPRIKLSQSLHDFGTVKGEKSLATIFVIRNLGAQRLVIRDVSDCCSPSQPPPLIIPAGSFGKLELVLRTPNEPRLVEDQHRFETNDPQSPTFILTLRARVRD